MLDANYHCDQNDDDCQCDQGDDDWWLSTWVGFSSWHNSGEWSAGDCCCTFIMIRVNSVRCTKKHESKDFIGCSTSFMILMVKIMKMLMLRVLFGANKIWFLPGCEAWCWVVLVPPGHPLHCRNLFSNVSNVSIQNLILDNIIMLAGPEVSLCLGVGQTYPGVKGVKHKVRLEKWKKVICKKRTISKYQIYCLLFEYFPSVFDQLQCTFSHS